MFLTSASLTLLLTCSPWIIAVSGDTQVNVTTGGEATLHCRAHRDGSIYQIAWNKTDLKSEKYVFFFRGNSSNVKCQLPSFHGRVELKDPQMKEGNASVVLKNVTAADSGTYECVVSMRGGRRRKRAAPFRHFVRLNVEDSGPKAGGSEEGGSEEGGSEDGGNKDEGILRGRSGLIVPIVAVVGVICVSVVIGLLVKNRPMKKKSEQPAADEQQQLSSPELVEVQVSA